MTQNNTQNNLLSQVPGWVWVLVAFLGGMLFTAILISARGAGLASKASGPVSRASRGGTGVGSGQRLFALSLDSPVKGSAYNLNDTIKVSARALDYQNFNGFIINYFEMGDDGYSKKVMHSFDCTAEVIGKSEFTCATEFPAAALGVGRRLVEAVVTDSDGVNHTASAEITIGSVAAPYLTYDLNGDGSVNFYDSVFLSNVVVGNIQCEKQNKCDPKKLDLNGDGRIGSGDLVILNQFLLKTYDANHDGKVTPDDIAAGGENSQAIIAYLKSLYDFDDTDGLYYNGFDQRDVDIIRDVAAGLQGCPTYGRSCNTNGDKDGKVSASDYSTVRNFYDLINKKNKLRR